MTHRADYGFLVPLTGSIDEMPTPGRSRAGLNHGSDSGERSRKLASIQSKPCLLMTTMPIL